MTRTPRVWLRHAIRTTPDTLRGMGEGTSTGAGAGDGDGEDTYAGEGTDEGSKYYSTVPASIARTR